MGRKEGRASNAMGGKKGSVGISDRAARSRGRVVMKASRGAVMVDWRER